MRVLAIVVLLMASLTAYAGQGGEGNNTGCNGQGNPNSPCEGNHNGKPDNGGTGVTIYDDRVTIYDSGSGAAPVAVDSRVGVTNNISTEIEAPTIPKPVPNAIAPSYGVYNNNSCLKPGGVAGSGSGFGFSLGGTKEDKNCEIRMMSDQLMRYGLEAEAIQTLCQSEYMRKAAEDVAKMRGTKSICYKHEEKKKSSNDFDIY